jgi:hypothetical protein
MLKLSKYLPKPIIMIISSYAAVYDIKKNMSLDIYNIPEFLREPRLTYYLTELINRNQVLVYYYFTSSEELLNYLNSKLVLTGFKYLDINYFQNSKGNAQMKEFIKILLRTIKKHSKYIYRYYEVEEYPQKVENFNKYFELKEICSKQLIDFFI